MSLGLFNIVSDRVVRRVTESALKKGVKLRDGRVFEIKQVLYADDRVLVAETRKHLQHTLNEFE